MALPVTIPNTFASATSSIPLSQLDTNFSTLANAINGINSGTETLANLKASNVTITGGIISNVTLDNVNVNVETFSNVTLVNVTVTSGTFTGITAANIAGANISSGNATFTNVTATQANLTTANITTLQSGNVVITGGTIAGITQLDVAGTTSAGSNIKLYEDTDNGTNYVSLKAADSIATNVTFTLPAADGTSGQVLQTNGTGTLSFTTPSSGITTGKSIAMAMIFGF